MDFNNTDLGENGREYHGMRHQRFAENESISFVQTVNAHTKHKLMLVTDKYKQNRLPTTNCTVSPLITFISASK